MLSCRFLSFCLTLPFVIVACGGESSRIESRFFTLHNAMAAMGMAQSGPVIQGKLAQGEEARVNLEVQPRSCLVFAAIGSSDVTNIDVIIQNENGQEIARDENASNQAVVRWCVNRPIRAQAIIRMVQGSGSYIAGVWASTSGSHRAHSPTTTTIGPAKVQTGIERSEQGTCTSPWPLRPGEKRRGSTTGAASQLSASCNEGSNAPEHLYLLEVDERVQLRAELRATFDSVLYLLGNCDEQQTEIACNDDTSQVNYSVLATTLEPGRYYLVVDGWSAEGGEYEVSYSVTPLPDVEAMCRNVTPLNLGQEIRGSTRNLFNLFQGSCAGAGPEKIYSFELSNASRFRARLESNFDSVLYLRKDCANQESEIACNDDQNEVSRSAITSILNAGTYYLFIDGYPSIEQAEQRGRPAAGEYVLSTEVAPLDGEVQAGDNCENPLIFEPSQALRSDTMRMRDDTRGSCGGQGAPDAVYRLEVRSRSRIRLVFNSEGEMPSAVYLQKQCGEPSTEIACISTTQQGEIDQTLTPGTYYLVVDGAIPQAFGEVTLNVRWNDLGQAERLCQNAPLIQPRRQVRGDTRGEGDHFQSSCGGQGSSPDKVYKLQIRRRSFVRISSEQQDWDGVLHLRRDCLDPMTELGCNDDAGDSTHSMIETILEPGTYYVFVDGYGSNSAGLFTLDVEVRNP